MATVEAASSSGGPRYAPDDPSLPKPWKGLIDGSTGVLYYWNPETNITQYEKPTALPPPLPAGPPPVPSTPKLAPIPGTRMVQSNGVSTQQGQQMTDTLEQQGEIPPLSQQHTQQLSQVAQQGSQAGMSMQQQGQLTPQQLRPQMMQQPSQQIFPFSDQQMPPQQGNQIPQQATHQMPQQMGQQTPMYQGAQLGQPQNYQFSHQQMHYMTYQQNMPNQGQQSLPQQAQGQQFSYQQEHKAGFPHRDDADIQQGKQIGFSPSHAKQTGLPFAQNPPAGTNSGPTPHMGVQPGQATQFGGSSVNMQQPPTLAHFMQSGTDLGYQQHGTRFQNQMGPALMHGQQSDVPTARSKMGFEEHPPGRVGNEYYFAADKDVHSMVPQQQPKLAAIPVARNQMV